MFKVRRDKRYKAFKTRWNKQTKGKRKGDLLPIKTSYRKFVRLIWNIRI